MADLTIGDLTPLGADVALTSMVEIETADGESYSATREELLGFAPTAVGVAVMEAANVPALQAGIGLLPGTDVQVQDPQLQSLAGLASVAPLTALANLTVVGQALKVLRVNAAENNFEYVAQTAGDALVANPLSQFAATTSAQLRSVLTDEIGTGLVVTAPTIAANALKVLRVNAGETDLEWATPSGGATDLAYTASARLLESSTGTDVTLPLAVAGGDAGLLTGSDKTKLDNTSGTNTGDQTNITGNAATVTVNDAAADTTTWPMLARNQTGDQSPTTDAGLTYNANTNALTAATFIGALNGNADTVTTNANLTGPITSTGNATAVAAQTGTGATFVMQDSPTLTTPNIGTPTAGTLTSCTGLPIAGLAASTSTAIGVGSVELGHASDTTIARVSAGVASIEGVDIATVSATQTLTNKRVNPRVQSVTGAATVTPNADSDDMVVITAQDQALTLANPSGTPVQGQRLIVRIKDNATGRAITYGTQYRAMGNTLPTPTTISKTLYLGFLYNSTDTKWDLVAKTEQA